MKYKIWFILCIVILFSITACSTNPIQPVCNKPYTLVGTSCCLNQNDNFICDKDEGPQTNQSTKFENITVIKNVTMPNLEITNLDCYTNVINWTHVEGKITNKGTATADYAFIYIDFFNGDKLVDTIETIPDDSEKGKHISPEESYTFSDLKEGLPTWTRCKAYTKYSNEMVQAIGGEAEQKVIVTRVIDGDTIQLSTGENVRLIGINAPERGEKCYEESKGFLESEIANKEITLEKDVEDKDQYGRLLRYVYVDGHNVNYGMIYLGYAHKYEYGSNTRDSSWYEEAENKAKEKCGCIWQPCSNISGNIPNYIKDQCFIVTNFHFNAVGDDNYNLNDEYVALKNNCNYKINMSRWTIKDETASHIYYFPDFSIIEKNSITLYTGEGDNTDSKLYWGRTSGDYTAIWNNNGDTLYLRNEQGDLVLTQGYSGY